jgi:hypothetical protein
MSKIFNVLGTPSSTAWPGIDLLPNYVAFEPREPLNLSSLFGKSKGPTGTALDLDLLLKMLALNPRKRITAEQVFPLFMQL